MENAEVSRIFRRIAYILQIKGENPFRVRAYERAARNIEALNEEITSLVKENRLRDIPGIGGDLEEKITELISTGRLAFLEELDKSIPEGVLDLLNIPSIGPKTAKLLFEKLGINSPAELKEALGRGELKGIPGIKDKTVANMLNGIALLEKGRQRMLLCDADELSAKILSGIKAAASLKTKAYVAGSVRRRKETIGDIDILAVSGKPAELMKVFSSLPVVSDISAEGDSKASARTKNGTQIDLRIVEKDSLGAALVYFTGSQGFNIKIRGLARKAGYKLNEYGLYSSTGSKLAGAGEKEIFRALKMQYIPPELREDRGEVELALASKLPKLVSLKDIKGDLHTHSTWSDGNSSIEEMATAARKLGYSYLALTDHSQSLRVAKGLNAVRLAQKKKEISELNSRLKDFKILYGTEVDIDTQGALDYDDGILAEFDIVVAAIHSGFRQSEKELTARVINACRNRRVNIIAHPTGRLWGTRDPYPLEMENIFAAAADTNTALEINSYSQRMDLDEINCRRAADKGVKLAVNTDSHRHGQLGTIEYGISIARRAWLGPEDIINTLPLSQLLKSLKK